MSPVRHPADRDGPGEQERLHQEHPVRLIEMPPDKELRCPEDRLIYFLQPCTEQIAVGRKLKRDERAGADQEQGGCRQVGPPALARFVAPGLLSPELPGAD